MPAPITTTKALHRFGGRRLGPLERPSPRVDGQLFQPHLQFGGRNLGARGERHAAGQAFNRADREVAGAAVPVRLEEIDRLGPDHVHIRRVRHRRDLDKPGRESPDGYRLQAFIAGELVENPAQHQGVGELDGVLDGRVAGLQQFRALRHGYLHLRRVDPPCCAPKSATSAG
jgi:hypothetical protein